MKRLGSAVAMSCAIVSALLVSASAAFGQNLSGMWDATVVVNDLTIPFHFQIEQKGASVKGSFFNGDEKVTSQSGLFKDSELVLSYPTYAATLTATFKDGRLDGQ